jgi:hypothetical protein
MSNLLGNEVLLERLTLVESQLAVALKQLESIEEYGTEEIDAAVALRSEIVRIRGIAKDLLDYHVSDDAAEVRDLLASILEGMDVR